MMRMKMSLAGILLSILGQMAFVDGALLRQRRAIVKGSHGWPVRMSSGKGWKWNTSKEFKHYWLKLYENGEIHLHELDEFGQANDKWTVCINVNKPSRKYNIDGFSNNDQDFEYGKSTWHIKHDVEGDGATKLDGFSLHIKDGYDYDLGRYDDQMAYSKWSFLFDITRSTRNTDPTESDIKYFEDVDLERKKRTQNTHEARQWIDTIDDLNIFESRRIKMVERIKSTRKFLEDATVDAEERKTFLAEAGAEFQKCFKDVEIFPQRYYNPDDGAYQCRKNRGALLIGLKGEFMGLIAHHQQKDKTEEDAVVAAADDAGVAADKC